MGSGSGILAEGNTIFQSVKDVAGGQGFSKDAFDPRPDLVCGLGRILG